MASIIRIKRSPNTGAPSGLSNGELGYTYGTGTVNNGGDRLYIGHGNETNGVAANISVIGGKYFTDLLDHAPGTLTATSALLVDSNKKIDDLLVDNLQLNGNTISTTDTNGNLVITPNGTGKTVVTNLHINDANTSIAEFIYDTVGGAITAGTGITITNDDGTNTSTVSITNTTVTGAGTAVGSSTAIPVITFNAQGQLTAVTTASITTTLGIASDSGTDSIALATDTLTFAGGEGIDTSINASTNTITIAAEDATTTNKGVASFDTNNFTVTSGAVSTKTITLGTSTLTNGSTTNTLAGLQQLDVDNIRIDGNEISSTDTNGNISLNPNGTGTVAVNASRITGVADPVDPQDAATKAYVDARAAGLDPKQSVKAATTGPITLNSPQTIDGVVLSAGDRVLVKDQADNTQNGIYVVAANVWSRSSDMDEPSELTAGLFFFVEQGTANGDAGFVKTSDSVGTVGTDPITFVQFSGAGQIIAGAALSKTGNQLDVVVAASGGIEISSDALQLKSSVAGDGLTYNSGVVAVVGTADRISVSTDAIDIASTYIGQTSITTLGTIVAGTWQGSIVGPTYGGTGVNNGTKTITLGGNFTHTGAHTLGLTTTANTSVTLPTTGTLATLDGTETFTNKTLTSPTISGGSINNATIGATTASTGAFTTLTSNDATTFTASTASSSSTTGAVIITGGVGVGGSIYGSGAATSTLDGFNIDGGTY
jgi:hypothetical protein